jgi:hypothetical protein
VIFVCANAEHIQRALPVITELGHFALIMAFVMSVAVSVLPFIGLRRGTSPFAALAAPATLAMMMAVCAAFAALLHGRACCQPFAFDQAADLQDFRNLGKP